MLTLRANHRLGDFHHLEYSDPTLVTGVVALVAAAALVDRERPDLVLRVTEVDEGLRSHLDEIEVGLDEGDHVDAVHEHGPARDVEEPGDERHEAGRNPGNFR